MGTPRQHRLRGEVGREYKDARGVCECRYTEGSKSRFGCGLIGL